MNMVGAGRADHEHEVFGVQRWRASVLSAASRDDVDGVAQAIGKLREALYGDTDPA